eukprot:g545.t1
MTYNAFLRRLRDPRLSGVAGFLIEFVRDVNSAEISDETSVSGRRVRAFVDRIAKHLRKHESFDSSIDASSILEWLEKFVMTRIYKRVFSADAEDATRDERLEKRIRMLSFVNFEHLDIRQSGPEFAGAWKRAAEVLGKIDSYKAPRDKLVTICNCCQFINGILSGGDADDESHVGADDFLPALIFVVLRSNPARLQSNLTYIRTYRHPSLLVLAQRYFFTALESAVAFVWGIRENSLSMSASEFRERVKRVVSSTREHPQCYEDAASVASTLLSEPLLKESVRSSSSSSDGDRLTPRARVSSPPTYEDDGGSSSSSSTLSSSLRLPQCRFRNVKSAGDLRIEDVGALLSEYKELVSACEALLDERERWIRNATRKQQ